MRFVPRHGLVHHLTEGLAAIDLVDRLQAEVTRSYAKWRSNKRPAAASLSPVAAERPQAYFGGAVALSKVIRWEVGQASEFDRVLTPEEIMDKLEQRVGPGRQEAA
jgi:hypothetical protein